MQKQNAKLIPLVSVLLLCGCGTDVHKIRSYPVLTQPEILRSIKERKIGEWVLHTSIDGVNLRIFTELQIYVSETGWGLIPIPTSREVLEKRNKKMTNEFMVVIGLNTETSGNVSLRNVTGVITFLDDRSMLYPNSVKLGVRRDCNSLPFAGNEINESSPIVYKSEELSEFPSDDLLANRIDLPLYTCLQFVYNHSADPRRVFEFRLGELTRANGQIKPVRIYFEPGHVKYINP